MDELAVARARRTAALLEEERRRLQEASDRIGEFAGQLVTDEYAATWVFRPEGGNR